MNRNRVLFLVLVVGLLGGAWLVSAKMESPHVQDSIDQKVEDLLGKMTLEEKVGQMNQYNGFWDATGPVPNEGDSKTKYDHLRKGWVGSVLNVVSVDRVRALQKIAVEETRLGIPLIFGMDVIHGHKTLAPIPLGEAASWDLQAIEKSARVAATEATAMGINWTFAPMVDISRDARWGRVMEGGGEDPFLGSLVGAARVRGFQGEDLAAPNTLIACAKHFAAYGFSESGREYNTVDVGTATLYNVVFPPFKAAADAGVRTFMNSFNILNGVPATGNAWLQREILKGEWNFRGFVVSDWASGAEMVEHGFANDLKEAAESAVIAGNDMDMESRTYVNHLVQLVEDGKVEEALVDDAVRRILRVKFELGLFDDPYRYCDAERQEEMLYHTDHMGAVLDMAKKSMVLLKNEGDLLPLTRGQEGIAVIGALANDGNSLLGSWRLGSDDDSGVSILEGLTQYAPDLTYTVGAELVRGNASFTQELSLNETDRSGFAEAIAAARKAETVVMVLGEHGYQSGKARSRTELDLPGLQQELLEAVYEVNPNIVLVLLNGRPLALPWAAENIPAILEAWQPGTQGGHAVAQVLFGDYNPAGKLPMTFPRSVGQVPIYYNQYSTGRPDPTSHVFWSHYSDEANVPLWPFGHGLSYTTFGYSDLKVQVNGPDQVEVRVTVANTGSREGEEVVQLYLHDQVAKVVRPVKELKGFQKIALAQGESQTLTFQLTAAELGYYDGAGKYHVDPGMFDLWVGPNSAEGLQASFELGDAQ